MTHNELRIIISGGGTGGHIFPAIAVAQELKSRLMGSESEIMFLGTQNGLESGLVPQAGFPIHFIGATKMKGKSLLGKFFALIKLPIYLAQALAYLLQFKPNLVIGCGGYVSFMAVLSGFLLRKKTFILEQNAVPGQTNRVLGRIADKIFLTFSVSAKYFKSQKVEIVGNPLRRQMEEAVSESKRQIDADNKFTILVLGGSQGAVSLNEGFLGALDLMGNRKFALRIIHQTGKISLERTQAKYTHMGLDASVYPFIYDLENVYPICDLVVSRAGAGGISEIMAFGKPSILVPYPFAADNHQWENARVLAEGKAAIVVKDDPDLPKNLFEGINQLWNRAGERESLANNARALHMPRPAERIVDTCLAGIAFSNANSGEGKPL